MPPTELAEKIVGSMRAPVDILPTYTRNITLLVSTEEVYIDPFHARHFIAISVVMYHMTYKQWTNEAVAMM